MISTKTLLNGLLCSLALTALSACENQVNGTFIANQAINVKSKSGGRVNTYTLAPGKHWLFVKTDVFSTVLTFTNASNHQKVGFSIAGLSDLQSQYKEGRLYLPASKTGQEFDMDLQLQMDVIRESGTRSQVESCVRGTYTEPYVDCDPREVCHRVNGRRRIECHYITECRTEYRTVTDYGQRVVRGFDRTQQRNATLKLLKGGKVLGTMKNASESPVTDFIRTDVGICR